MGSVERSTDIVEQRSETAFIYGFIGLALLSLGGLLWVYNQEGGPLIWLSYVLLASGVGCFGNAVYTAWQIRKVTHIEVICPYCEVTNLLSKLPNFDFRCIGCNRSIPVEDGAVLPVYRVLCGNCREPNWFSDKSLVLLCENCNHEIPITHGDGTEPIHSLFAVVDDERSYELSIVGFEHGSEELISCLQHMLALNRNQVKDILQNLPQVLLTGIPKKKAEMLAIQLKTHGAVTDSKAL